LREWHMIHIDLPPTPMAHLELVPLKMEMPLLGGFVLKEILMELHFSDIALPERDPDQQGQNEPTLKPCGTLESLADTVVPRLHEGEPSFGHQGMGHLIEQVERDHMVLLHVHGLDWRQSTREFEQCCLVGVLDHTGNRGDIACGMSGVGCELRPQALAMPL